MYRFANIDPFMWLTPDSGGGNGGSGDDGDDGDEGGGIEQALTRLLSKASGNANEVALDLYKDNFKLRQKNRNLTTQLTAAQGALPTEGTLVLSKEDAAAWEAYKALGKPADVVKRLTDGDAHGTELTKLRRSETLRAVAEVSGYKPSVLSTLDAQVGGLEYEVKGETKDGQTRKVAYVKDEKGASVPVSQYAENHWGDFLPSLRAEQPQQGTRFVQQTMHGAPVKDVAQEFLKQAQAARDALPNPLAAKPPVVSTGL